MARSILAVATGFILIAVLSFAADFALRAVFPGAFPQAGMVTDTTVLVLSSLSVAVFAIGGCYLAARMAPDRPLRHALVLGVLGLVFQLSMLPMTLGTVPAWYLVGNLVLVMPYAYAGGWLRERELRHAPSARPAAG